MIINDGLGSIDLTEVSPTSWLLQHTFTYITKSGKAITIPEGFETDGASSPLRILITTFGGHYSTASIVHDYLYYRINSGHPAYAAPTRKEADAILLEIMDRCGVNYWVKWAIWFVVRGFGGPDLRKLGVRQ